MSSAKMLWFRHIRQFTTRTQVHYKMVINNFEKFAPMYVNSLKLEHIERYIDTILKTRTNRTANAHLTALKSFCRFLESHELPNPCRKIKMLREEPPKIRVLSEQEYHKVLSVCNDGQADVIRFLANTGLRLTEARNLTMRNISHDLNYITLTGKGRKHRLIPLNTTCREIIAKHNTTINFLESYKSRDALYRLCKCLANRAAINRFGPHALRHYFATALYEKGIPISKISRILGHSSVRTTETIYIHWLPQDLLGITDCLD